MQSTMGIFPTGKRDKAELGSPLSSPSWASGILDGDRRGYASSLRVSHGSWVSFFGALHTASGI